MCGFTYRFHHHDLASPPLDRLNVVSSCTDLDYDYNIKEVNISSGKVILDIRMKNVCHCRLNVFRNDIVSLADATSA